MAAAAPPETALPAAAGPACEDEEEDEEQCRICRLPAEADRPLRHPCACHGSIRFVHDDCQLRWMAIRRLHRCEVCKRPISTCLLYAADAPARLSVSEFMLGAPNRIMGLLLPLFFAICVVRDSFIRLTTLWTWRLMLARTFAQVHHLLSTSFSTTSVIASIAIWVVCANKVAPFAVAPFARWVERLEARRHGFRGFDGLQVLALVAVEVSSLVLTVDMVLAFIFGFLPFSLGRMILWCVSCFNFGNVDEVDSYTSTASILLFGYGFIFSVGVTFAGLCTFCQYLVGERLMIVIFLTSLCGIFFRGIVYLITLGNTCLNLLNILILHPLLIGWLLDICTSKMFDATMSERFKLLIASSIASNALHWLVGNIILSLRPKLSKLLHQILRPGVTIPFVHHNVREPFYIFYFKKLPGLFVDIIFIVLVILVPVKIAVQLAPGVFPLDITYFDRPAKGAPFWQGLLYCAESLSGIHHMKFLIGNTVLYLKWLVERVTLYWFVTAGGALGNNVTQKDQYRSSDEVNDKRRYVAVGTRVVLAWLTVVIFSCAMLLFSISVGRRFLFAIPQLPVAGRLKSNDLFAFTVGFCIISTIIAVARDSFACMVSGGTRLLALEMHLLFFIWIFIIPLLTGLLVDLLLLSPFIGPDDDVPALGFFCTWLLGRVLQNIASNLAPGFGLFLPFMAYFIDESWDGEICLAREVLTSVRLIWLLEDELMPVATKLLTALVVPYVLAKGIFPRLGYSVAVNSTVYRFAWLGSLTFCVLCCLAKVFCIKLHDSIRDDHYVTGKRLEDVDSS
ncbi:probable E3 ubiquitin ligase SUD1 [Lolium perenne]|uniref:probable E3 ubiquitin ligase SUD1 n=1 Tax=Lolium perenne TaxID=4522 RepID=UPI0021F53488|nr:probable E3 ubiquitin ligase SUD1 isoform X1 [Lolium perenne]